MFDKPQIFQIHWLFYASINGDEGEKWPLIYALSFHIFQVSEEEGRDLAQQLGCHLFREISVKESWQDSKSVYLELWRRFRSNSPNSPSQTQRKKFSYRLQHKIPVMYSSSNCVAAPPTAEPVAAVKRRTTPARHLSDSVIHAKSRVSESRRLHHQQDDHDSSESEHRFFSSPSSGDAVK